MISVGLDQPEAQYGCPVAYTYTEGEIHDLLDDYFDMLSLSTEIISFHIR